MKPYVVLSHTPWCNVPTRTQQLVTRLKNSTVLFFQPAAPANSKHREQGRQVRPNVFVYTLPPTPKLPQWMGPVLTLTYRKQGAFIQKAMDKHRFHAPVLWVTCPQQVHLLSHIPFRGLVYDCDQDWSQLPSQWEGELAELSDVVFAASPWLVERLSPCNQNIALLPNGVNFSMYCQKHLDAPPDLTALPRPILGFSGAITSDLDLAPLEYTAAQHPEWSFVLLGQVSENPRLSHLKDLPNVHLLGHRPMTDVPDYLQQFDVCLELRRARQSLDDVLPSRIYEYLSTGKPVVTHLFLDQVEEYPDVIYGAQSLPEFAQLCQRALDEDETWVTTRRRNYGNAAAWSNRSAQVQEILSAIGLYSTTP